MKKHIFLSLVLPAAALVVGLSPRVALASYSCAGGTCTGSYDTGSLPTDLGSALNGPTTFSMQQFDTQGGSLYLTSVSVTFTGAISSSGTISNNNDSALTYTVGVDSLFSAAAISSQLATLVGAINTAELDPVVRQVNGTILANTANQTFVPTSSNPASASTGALNLADLVDFENNGGGTLTANLATHSTVSQSTQGGGGSLAVTTNLNTNAEGTLTYTYTYASTPVPEPASMALLGSGLFGLGWVRRRRAAKRG